MKLRNKVLIALGCAWISFLLLTYYGSNTFLIKSFLELEKDRANRDLGRIDQALDQINYSLYTYTSDWSHWNDLYSFMQGQNPSFVPNNLNMTAFVNSHINFLTYWNLEGKIVIGTAIDTDKQKLIAYPPGINRYLYAGSRLLNRKDIENDIRGYLLTNKGIMLVAAAAVTDGDKLLPPLGAMVTARNLNADLIDKISSTTNLKITLHQHQIIQENNSLKEIQLNTVKNDDHLSVPINEEILYGYTVIRDIDKKPIGMFQMTTPRAIYLSGKEAINYFSMSFVLLAIIFSFLIYKLLGKLIIQRLETLNNQVRNITHLNSIQQRVDVSSNDELSSVSSEINKMLDTIQISQEQLEHRVQERTDELHQTNIQLEQEINERKAVEQELLVHKEHLARLAHYDHLTTLPNRVFFNEILNKKIQQAKQDNEVFSIFFIDLDRFKNINDALGHTMGDLLLKKIGNRFKNLVKTGDALARLGGDEFIMLANSVDQQEAANIASNLLNSTHKPVRIEKHEFYITASIGICNFPADGESLEDLQKNADMAMYKAKRNGGGIYQFYTHDLNEEAKNYLQTEAALRRALSNQEFILYFQPQLNLKDDSITRFETLIRWEDPEVGMISPGTFIPIAEETGLIIPISDWVLQEACRILKKWHNQGYTKICLAVNISSKQFRHKGLIPSIQKAIIQSGISPEFLELEITETAVMDDVDIAIKKLQTIKSMGIRISMDDFGTGYTSIGYLKKFPIDTLKIDQTFIKGIPDNQNDTAITSAVIALGHSLGLEVVAEGVENAEQLQYLADHHCDLIQGYFISRPLPESKALSTLIKHEETENI